MADFTISQPNRDLKGRFLKGTKPSPSTQFKKGQKHPKEWYLNRTAWNKDTKGLVKPNKTSFKKGVRVSPNTEFKLGSIPKHAGKPRPELAKENHWNWKGGITTLTMVIRTSLEYAQWRREVFIRDNFTCRTCGQIGGKLNADHIKLFALYPELVFNVDNGQTLCFSCHKMKTKNDWSVLKAERRFPL